jgi:predicted amidohydrolase YtcJ
MKLLMTQLKVRINSYSHEEYSNLEKHMSSSGAIDQFFFTIKGFKAYYDGSLGSETALFSGNYLGKQHNGYMTDTVTSGDLSKYSLEIDKHGGQLIIHAIGDLAVTQVLNLYEELIKYNGARERRHRIEHAQHINRNDIQRFKELRTVASVQPLHLKYDIGIVKDKLPYTTHNYKQLIDKVQ